MFLYAVFVGFLNVVFIGKYSNTKLRILGHRMSTKDILKSSTFSQMVKFKENCVTHIRSKLFAVLEDKSCRFCSHVRHTNEEETFHLPSRYRRKKADGS